jgi:hypothetical protein
MVSHGWHIGTGSLGLGRMINFLPFYWTVAGEFSICPGSQPLDIVLTYIN